MVQPLRAQDREEQLAQLIALMYRSAAEPELWASFLERLRILFRANFTNVGLVTQPEQAWWFGRPESLIQKQQDVNVVFQQGLSADDLLELSVRWVTVDGLSLPGFQRALQRRHSVVADRREFISDSTFDHLPYCHEFALPHDYYHGLASGVLAQNRSLGLFVNIYRPWRYGPFGDEETGWLQRLVPHLEQALDVHQQWRTLRQQTRSRALALDAVDRPCLTVDSQGHVLWASRAAEALLERGDGLGVRGGVLTASEPTEQATLITALRLYTHPGRDLLPQSGTTLILSRRRAEQPLKVTLLHVPPEQREGPEKCEVLLLLNDPEQDRLPTAQRLERLYRLTPAESRVALSVARGLTTEQIAEQGRGAAGTVRNQLKQVLSKTNTHRQSALVRLLLSLSEPD